MKIKFKGKDKIILIVLIALLIITKLGVKIKQDNIDVKIDSDSSQISIEKEKPKKEFKVHIDGEVTNPGVYKIKENKRLDDLVKMAGGLSKDADKSRINLARKLSDGMKIFIPSKNNKEADLKNYDKLTLVDFNKMNKEELKSIEGIGEVIALRILEYKKNNGNFNKIEDLLNVNGIGEKKLEKIRSKIY